MSTHNIRFYGEISKIVLKYQLIPFLSVPLAGWVGGWGVTRKYQSNYICIFLSFYRALFWTDWDGHNPRIEGCSMSGEGRKVIHKIIPAEGGGWPNGLTIDYDFKRLYWIDAR